MVEEIGAVSAIKDNHPVPVVAIGAADGGIESITALLHHLPKDTGLAYCYVQFPEVAVVPGELLALLTGITQLVVVEAADGMVVAPDHLYLLPLDRALYLVLDTFRSKEKPPGAFLPINSFFTALADTHKERCIGILLSGGLSDGILGMRSIKLAGGLTYVQDQSAQFQTIAKAAFAQDIADRILSPEELAEELSRFARVKDRYLSVITDMDDEQVPNGDKDLAGIVDLLNRTTGVDFAQYKMSTIKRRIIRRMMLYKQDTLADYHAYLAKNAVEVGFLYQDLLINVTAFFRDKETAEFIRKTLLPRIIRSKTTGEPFRIWTPACSTGQETYSLAMMVIEALGENPNNITIQIFATDLSEAALAKARLGMYTREDLADLDPRWLQRFFNKSDGQYSVVKSLRDLCIFANHNILKDPPFSRLDLISCCNLLIYLNTSLQRRLMSTFHYSLRNQGYLVLGKSETVGSAAYLFSQLDKKVKIYAKKKEATPKAVFEMTYGRPESQAGMPRKNITVTAKSKHDDTELEKVVDKLLLKKFTPASVVINLDLDILQFRGSTGLYLEPSPGKASLNLLKMAKPGLGFELRNIVHKAKKNGKAEKKEGLEIVTDGVSQWVTIEAVPLKMESEDEFFLVAFDHFRQASEDKEKTFAKDQRSAQLEQELTSLREDMRSIVESQEAANEELQSANEEILSSNEELQSINEELETSKEEIESSNEELITINQELLMRNEQLAESQEYSVAVFTTIRESLLILDKDLHVRMANKAFYKTFGLLEEEVEGRLIYDIGNKQWSIPKLKELLEDYLPNNFSTTGFELQHFFPGTGEKMLVINARNISQKTHGQHIILLAIEDITEFKQAQLIISEREAWFRNMADNLPSMIWVTGLDTLCSFVNKTYLEYRGITLEAAVGRPWTLGIEPEDAARCQKLYEQSFMDRTPFEVVHKLRDRDGNYKIILTKAKPNYSLSEVFTGFIGNCVEIDEKVKKVITV